MRATSTGRLNYPKGRGGMISTYSLRLQPPLYKPEGSVWLTIHTMTAIAKSAAAYQSQ